MSFFGSLYNKPDKDSWRIEGLDWSPISEETVRLLEHFFSKKEIQGAVLQMDKEKTPSHDSFT